MEKELRQEERRAEREEALSAAIEYDRQMEKKQHKPSSLNEKTLVPSLSNEELQDLDPREAQMLYEQQREELNQKAMEANRDVANENPQTFEDQASAEAYIDQAGFSF